MASNSTSPDSLPFGSMHISDPVQFYQSKKGSIDTINCKVSAPPGLSNPRSLLLDTQSCNLFIVDSDNNRIVVLTMEWEFVSMFGEKDLDSPWGVAILSDSVFVTDVGHHGLLKFSLFDFTLITRVSSTTENKKLKEPRGITSDGNEIFVADSGSHAICIFNSELEFLRYIGIGDLWFPRDVKLSQDSITAIDKSDTCVHIFSKGGEKKKDIIPLDPNRKSSPLFFHIDTSGSIILSDYDSKTLQIFDLSGNSIHTIQVDENPKGVLVIKDKLFCCYTDKIQIF
ncbi:hypothetical protein LOD99_13183 [Oopsacas minuta]|uniref:Uncharacterized protein n=1 Tax=Oopsacas minuta TaxID=111878 RepID=A0AAV7JB78_9METZ|nr:hypothetical protein LOD99_13183 [Oopsacas minuta]